MDHTPSCPLRHSDHSHMLNTQSTHQRPSQHIQPGKARSSSIECLSTHQHRIRCKVSMRCCHRQLVQPHTQHMTQSQATSTRPAHTQHMTRHPPHPSIDHQCTICNRAAHDHPRTDQPGSRCKTAEPQPSDTDPQHTDCTHPRHWICCKADQHHKQCMTQTQAQTHIRQRTPHTVLTGQSLDPSSCDRTVRTPLVLSR